MKVAALFVVVLALFAMAPAAPARAQQLNVCGLCSLAVSYIEGYVAENYTEAQITKAIEIVCKIAPGPYESQCDEVIEAYVPEVISLIINKENPQTICKQVKLCPASIMAFKPLPVPVKKPLVAKPASNPQLCGVCMMIVGLVETYLTNNQGVDTIKNAVDSLCAITPIAAQCDAFANDAINQLIWIIKNDEDPTTACKQLQVC